MTRLHLRAAEEQEEKEREGEIQVEGVFEEEDGEQQQKNVQTHT